MKKLLLLGVTMSLMLPLEAPVEAAVVTSTQKELKSTLSFKRKKARGYRKKKGFMWGLFKKKNSCGCPKF
ncbi:hypothetical protein [Larkinella arboricola]|uniref:Uncharacterized protein n=1 Tax=Larkinella arboricola TaxID=643671 RepID=A0A327X4S3_LARAB|nr:hypothetical protein [Larkinella arboricola]RAK01895.1 hypothetical protein LX87_00009 [Larkinella arboricola]